jgi:hypothetical protein
MSTKNTKNTKIEAVKINEHHFKKLDEDPYDSYPKKSEDFDYSRKNVLEHVSKYPLERTKPKRAGSKYKTRKLRNKYRKSTNKYRKSKNRKHNTRRYKK